jgi:hypothetical protein
MGPWRYASMSSFRNIATIIIRLCLGRGHPYPFLCPSGLRANMCNCTLFKEGIYLKMGSSRIMPISTRTE